MINGLAVFSKFSNILKPVGSLNATKCQPSSSLKLLAAQQLEATHLLQIEPLDRAVLWIIVYTFLPLFSLLFLSPTSSIKISHLTTQPLLLSVLEKKESFKKTRCRSDPAAFVQGRGAVMARAKQGQNAREATRRLLSDDSELIRAHKSSKVTLPSCP